MRILLIHNFYKQAGGEDGVFTSECALLQAHGHSVIEYTDKNEHINRNFSVASNTIWSRESYKKLQELIKKTRPHIAHFHNTFLQISPSAYYACYEKEIPVVQTLHNYRLLCPNALFFRDNHVCEDCLGQTPPWAGVLHRCYRDSHSQTLVSAIMITLHRWLKTWEEKVDIYIALTEFSRQKFIQGGIPEEKIVVKPNFVYPDPGVRTSDKSKYVVFVGRLSTEKGLHTLLNAWRNLNPIPLKIVGDGPLLSETQEFIKIEHLENIELLGHCSHSDVLELIKQARLLILPSVLYENFPLTIAEAFACGIPVIASRLGAMEEIIEDGQTGLHFTPGNAESLVSKVDWAWTHPNQMREMGRNARHEYEEKYTAERNYEKLIDIYTKAITTSKS